MSHISPLKYAFAVAKIRVLENSLIRQEVFLQALAAELAEALKLFVEEGRYGDQLLHVAGSNDLETVLTNERRNLLALINDLLLDKWLQPLIEPGTLDDICTVLRRRPGRFLEDYLRHVIDLHNLKTFLRLQALGEPLERLEELVIAVGFIQKETLLRDYGRERTAFMRSLARTVKHEKTIDYAHYFRPAIESVEKERSFVSLEKRIADFLIGELKPAKTIVFGPEPLLAYYWARMNEMHLIRLVILAKLNWVAAERVKERLNDVYA